MLFRFILGIILVLLEIIRCESNNDNVVLDHHYVIEINDYSQLEEFFLDNPKFILEFFIPQCDSSNKFSSKYNFLAQVYQEKIKFVKINWVEMSKSLNSNNSTNSAANKTLNFGIGLDLKAFIMQVFTFPSIYIYDKLNFYLYKGFRDISSVHNFIERTYFYDCKLIESEQSLINLIEENRGVESYVIGIFNENQSEVIEKFKEINKENRLIVTDCYYFINSGIKRDSLPYVYNLNNLDNFILVNNKVKFSTFTELDLLTRERSFIIEERVKGLYRTFLLDNLFPGYEEWRDDMDITNLQSRGEYWIFFQYESEELKAKMIDLILEYNIYMKSKDRINLSISTPILLDLTVTKKFFEKRAGVFIFDSGLKSFDSIEKEEELNLDNIIEKLKKFEEKLSNKRKILNSIKTEEHLAEKSYKEIKHKIDPFLKYLVYLLIYSLIFYILYKRYISSIKIETKEN